MKFVHYWCTMLDMNVRGGYAVLSVFSNLLPNSIGMSLFVSVLDILIIAFAIYKILELMQGTRAMPLAKGVAILIAFSVISEALGLTTVNWVLVQLQKMFVIVIPIVFAPELRRGLEQLGNGYFPTKPHKQDNHALVDHQIKEVLGCATVASASRTGVLMALTRENTLKEYIATGISINGDLSASLLNNIFIVNTPLHDGAVIITDNKIMAASCFLPLSDSNQISMTLGTRHRAAIGLSEVSDAVIVVVSEETGAMSVAERGRLHYDLGAEAMVNLLRKLLTEAEEASPANRIKKVIGR